MSLIKKGPLAHFDCGSDCNEAIAENITAGDEPLQSVVRQLVEALDNLLDEHVDDYGDNPIYDSLNAAVKQANAAVTAARAWLEQEAR